MNWILKYILKPVAKVLVAAFRWAFDNPTAGIVIGAGVMLYGIIVDDGRYFWTGAAILATGIIGHTYSLATEIYKVAADTAAAGTAWYSNIFFSLFSPTPVP